MLRQSTQTWFSSENKTLVLGRIWLWECEQEGKINLPKLFSCHEVSKPESKNFQKLWSLYPDKQWNRLSIPFKSGTFKRPIISTCRHRGSAKAISKNFSKEWENIISGFQNKINKIYLIKVRGQQCNEEYILQRPSSGA